MKISKSAYLKDFNQNQLIAIWFYSTYLNPNMKSSYNYNKLLVLLFYTYSWGKKGIQQNAIDGAKLP